MFLYSHHPSVFMAIPSSSVLSIIFTPLLLFIHWNQVSTTFYSMSLVSSSLSAMFFSLVFYLYCNCSPASLLHHKCLLAFISNWFPFLRLCTLQFIATIFHAIFSKLFYYNYGCCIVLVIIAMSSQSFWSFADYFGVVSYFFLSNFIWHAWIIFLRLYTLLSIGILCD